jgi:urease alpha subunit
MSDLNTVGHNDGWRCWLCDAPVDPDASTNSDLGPSVDSYAVAKAKKGSAVVERLAHRACNTKKGKIAPVVAWSPDLFVVDPAPIFEAVERLAARVAAKW